MTVKELKAKHKRDRKARRIKKVKNGIGIILLIALMFGFAELWASAWDKDFENQERYNQEYIQEMVIERAE